MNRMSFRDDDVRATHEIKNAVIIGGRAPVERKHHGVRSTVLTPRKKKKRAKTITAYNVFFRSMLEEIKSSTNEKLNLGEVMKKVGPIWSELSPKERQKYKNEAAKESRLLKLEFDEQQKKKFEEQRLARIKERQQLAKGTTGPTVKKKKKSSSEEDSSWKTCWNQHQRKGAVNRGMDYIFRLSTDKENFSYFGNDIIQCFYDVSTVTGEPIRLRCLMFLELLANRWREEMATQGWANDSDNPTCQEVIDVVTGMYCLERVSVAHNLKPGVLKAAKIFTALDYFGFDPEKETVPVEPIPDKCKECGATQQDRRRQMCNNCGKQLTLNSRFRTMSNALINSFYAYKAGIDFGTPFLSVLKHLPELRPYQGHHELSWEEYNDQCYLVTHVVFVLSNWGELALDKNMFPHEYFFIVRNLPIHLHTGDIHLVSEFLECLRIFGTKDSNDKIQEGISFLLDSQAKDGSWDSGKASDAYTAYHATMCACQAMLAHKYRGYGPGVVEAAPLLMSWHEAEVQASMAYEDRPVELRGDDVDAAIVEIQGNFLERQQRLKADLLLEEKLEEEQKKQKEAEVEKEQKQAPQQNKVAVKAKPTKPKIVPSGAVHKKTGIDLTTSSKKPKIVPSGAVHKKTGIDLTTSSKKNSLDFTKTGQLSSSASSTDEMNDKKKMKKSKRKHEEVDDEDVFEENKIDESESARKKTKKKKVKGNPNAPTEDSEVLLTLKQLGIALKKLVKSDAKEDPTATKKIKKSMKKTLKELLQVKIKSPEAFLSSDLPAVLIQLGSHTDVQIREWSAGVMNYGKE